MLATRTTAYLRRHNLFLIHSKNSCCNIHDQEASSFTPAFLLFPQDTDASPSRYYLVIRLAGTRWWKNLRCKCVIRCVDGVVTYYWDWSEVWSWRRGVGLERGGGSIDPKSDPTQPLGWPCVRTGWHYISVETGKLIYVISTGNKSCASQTTKPSKIWHKCMRNAGVPVGGHIMTDCEHIHVIISQKRYLCAAVHQV